MLPAICRMLVSTADRLHQAPESVRKRMIMLHVPSTGCKALRSPWCTRMYARTRRTLYTMQVSSSLQNGTVPVTSLKGAGCTDQVGPRRASYVILNRNALAAAVAVPNPLQPTAVSRSMGADRFLICIIYASCRRVWAVSQHDVRTYITRAG